MRSFLTSISRGAGLKLASDIVGRVLQYVLLWLAARTLGEAGFGDFSLALSVGYMVAQVADFGLQLFVQRELARMVASGAENAHTFDDPEAAGRLVGGGLVIKGALSAVAMSIIVLLIAVEPVQEKGALVLVGLSMVLMTLLEYLAYCFRALRRLQNEALANITGKAVNLALGAGLLLWGGGVWGLAIAGNVAMLAAIALSYVQLLKYVRPLWRPDWSFWRRTSGQSAALGIGIVFGIVSFRVDNLLIVPLVGRADLGNYSVAYKLFEPTLIVPAAVLAATFPVLSRAAHVGGAGSRAFAPLFKNTMLLLLALGAGVTAGLGLLSIPIIRFLYAGEYVAAGPLLQILALACLPMFLNYGLMHGLIALDKTHLYAAFTLSALLVNVTANLALLPTIGVTGAAVATILSEITLFTLSAAVLLREVPRVRHRFGAGDPQSAERAAGAQGSLKP